MQELNQTTRPTIVQYFSNMVELVSSRSTCLRRKVGCVLVDNDNHVLATGYNGAPACLEHCKELPCIRMTKGLDYCRAVHAEQNALLQCKDVTKIKRAFITTSPCVTCVKLLLNTSCTEIVFVEEYSSQDCTSKELWLSKPGNRWIKFNGETAIVN